MGRLELVTGGARSGKSAFAERRALALASTDHPPRTVTYVATAVAVDAEMAGRIARHRARRPGAWRTVEAPETLAAAVIDACGRPGVVLVDCLGVWVTNRLMALGDPEAPDADAAAWWEAAEVLEASLAAELTALCDAAMAGPADVLLVTNEVGFGLVPPTPLGRAFRDLLGRCSQLVASRADAVHLVVAGIAIDIARLAAPGTGGPGGT